MQGERGVRLRVIADLRLSDVVMIGLGAMVGTSVYVLLGGAAAVAGPAVLIALVLNSGLVALSAASYAELGSTFPRAGGGYAWVKEGLPPPMGFLAGMLTWGGNLTAVALSALGLAAFLNFGLRAHGISLLSDPTETPLFAVAFRPSEKLLALAAIAGFAALNLRSGTPHGPGRVPYLKIALVVVFLAIGFAAVVPAWDNARFASALPYGAGGILLAMGVTFVAFEGYEAVAASSEQVRDPSRTVPRGIAIAFSFTTVAYVLLYAIALNGVAVRPPCANAAECLAAWPEPELGMVRAGMDMALFAPLPLVAVLTGGVVAMAAGVFSNLARSARATVILGSDGILPPALGRTWKDGRTPTNALLFSFAVAAALALVLDLYQLALASAIFFLLLFSLVNISLVTWRKRRPDLPRRFRVPFAPALPYAAAGLNVLLALALFTFPPEPGGTGPGIVAWYVVLLWLGLGLVYHFIAGGRKTLAEPSQLESLLETPDPFEREKYRVFLPLKSFEDEPLVRFAADVARARGGELSLVNVVEIPRNLPPKALRFSYVDQRMRGLERLARVARREGVEARATVKIGHRPYDIVLDTLRDEDANLLVLGFAAGSRTVFSLGSTLSDLIANSPCDVAVVSAHGLREELRRVAVVLGPGPSTGLLELAEALAPGGTVTLVAAPTDATMAVKLREQMASLAAKAEPGGRVPERRELAAGPIDASLESVSKEYDVLVLGMPGKTIAPNSALYRQLPTLACPAVLYRPRPPTGA